MKILVIGYGYVGKAMVEFLNLRYDVDVYDLYTEMSVAEFNTEGINFITRKQQKENKYDLVVICTPTPMNDDGSCDTSYVRDALENSNAKVYLIKSTIEPGFTDKLIQDTGKEIVFSPEYVGESKYYNPYFPDKMVETPFMILGGKQESTKKVIDVLLPILGPAKKILQMKAIEAEIVKYMENTFFSTKITYCQEMFDLCEKAGADWNTVREGWLLDPRINPMHTAVFRHDRGFSGKCLPKDTNALYSYSKKLNVESKILKAVLEKNKELRSP